MLVREGMSSPVISITEHESVSNVAKLMRDQKVGAIIIINAEGNPVGIVTERDIVNRVVADGNSPNEILVKDIMTAPLKTVDPEMNLMDAMNLMDKMNIRRLGVSYKGELVGIISDRNIIRIVPTIFEIMKEYQAINQSNPRIGPSTVGYCERCEIYSTNLRAIDGEFLCEDCRVEENYP
jgi:CBS domain-containing protein